MVLGQDEQIDQATRDEFRASGLAHVLAVSGQNVMLLAALALPLLAAAGVGHRARLAGTVALIALYVPLAGRGSVAAAGGRDGRGVAGRPGGRAAGLALVRAAARRLRHAGRQPARLRRTRAGSSPSPPSPGS